MLLVRTKLGPSRVHGIGLFAAQFISRGTVTWRYHPDFDRAFSESDLERMSEPAREQFLKYAYYDKALRQFVLCFDDARFINHSTESPNIGSSPTQDIALRDIQEGEELLCDYNGFDDNYLLRAGLSHL